MAMTVCPVLEGPRVDPAQVRADYRLILFPHAFLMMRRSPADCSRYWVMNLQ
jgi:hypothetical protein